MSAPMRLEYDDPLRPGSDMCRVGRWCQAHSAIEAESVLLPLRDLGQYSQTGARRRQLTFSIRNISIMKLTLGHGSNIVVGE